MANAGAQRPRPKPALLWMVWLGFTGELRCDSVGGLYLAGGGNVGLTEEQLKERGIPYHKSSIFPFSGVGRALCLGAKEGFVKILTHARTNRVVGGHIIGPHASELIAECTLAMEFGASAEDLARTIHAHPTLSESIQEAARPLMG